MRQILLLIPLICLGCASGYDGEREAVSQQLRAAWQATGQLSEDPYERIGLVYVTEEYQQAASRRDSILAKPPSIRWYNDSLAHYDSLAYAYMLGSRVSALYYSGDTTEAVFAYLEALPWLHAHSTVIQIDEARRFAEMAGDAVREMRSPNMARLTYEAFEHAEEIALREGDTNLAMLVDSSRGDRDLLALQLTRP